MGVKVVKFGGSSVADAIQLQKVKSIVMSDPDRKYVVVSAPGKRYSDDNKITDLLYLCQDSYRSQHTGRPCFPGHLRQIQDHGAQSRRKCRH